MYIICIELHCFAKQSQFKTKLCLYQNKICEKSPIKLFYRKWSSNWWLAKLVLVKL